MIKRIIGLSMMMLIMGARGLSAQQTYPVTFSLKAPLETSSVAVAGDFNNWSVDGNPLFYDGDEDIWRTTVELAPAIYEYRFILNKIHWIKDPVNPRWGGEQSNSLRYVRSPHAPDLTNVEPENGEMVHGRVFRVSADYRPGVSRDELDADATRILIDGSEITIDYVPEKRRIQGLSPQLKDGEHIVDFQAFDTNGNMTIPHRSMVIVNANNAAPQVEAGYTIISGVGEKAYLNSGVYHDPDFDTMVKYDWELVSRPEGSKIKLSDSDSPFPWLSPDVEGRYLFHLKISDGKLFSSADSVDLYAFSRKKYPVEFRLSGDEYTRIYESNLDSAAVVGEFNQWSATANPMTDYNHDNVWTAWIDLDPGEYEYKYVVNGQHWMSDPDNPLKAEDGWNGFNSIKRVTLNLAPHIDVKPSFLPGKLLFDASASYSKTGKKLYYLWYQDINNPERYTLKGDDKLTIPVPSKNGIYYYYLILSDSFGSSSQKTIVLKVKNRKVEIKDYSQSPDWGRDAIIYEVYVKRFTEEGDLQGVISRLPYLKRLGINCIWLMPVFESPTENGYGPTDFFSIDGQYGSADDLRELIDKSHQAGIRIIMDFIANHSSDQHRYFLSAFNNSSSIFRDWYLWNDDADEDLFYRYQFHNDWDRLPNFNYQNPQVRKHIMDAAEFWANFGIDGYRCDVAWGIPHDFWKLFRRELKMMNPDFLLLNETLPRSPLYHQDEFDMSYDTDFYGNLLDVMRDRKPVRAIDYGLRKTDLNYPAHALNLRYIENHDMDRFITQFGIRETKLAASLLLTIPGTPLIMYGQELGMREKLAPMQWSQEDDPLYQFYRRLITLRRNYKSLGRGDFTKITSNAEDKIYAYLRSDDKSAFLVVLNFFSEPVECQLLFPEEVRTIQGDIYLEEMLTKTINKIDKVDAQRIRIKIDQKSAYIYKIR